MFKMKQLDLYPVLNISYKAIYEILLVRKAISSEFKKRGT